MKLLLDPAGGIAGDMFAAALISAGADENSMIHAMTLAADKIGQSKIWIEKTADNSSRFRMDMNHNHGHLAASKARKLLAELLIELDVEYTYRTFANDVLEILISAEKQAHSENTFLTDHHHSHSGDHHHHHDHSHSHSHSHSHHHEEEAWLHEAQDIIIDIIGAAVGLQLLNAPTVACILNPVSLGGGHIKFSHGEMSVPAPATKIIMDKFNISTLMGPVDVELCTPTGSALLAALKVELCSDIDINSDWLYKGYSRGGKDLPIAPLGLFLK